MFTFPKDLLRHPLCLTLVREKWMKYGKRTFIFQLITYALFLASLTTFVLTSPSPVTHPQYYNCSQFFENSSFRPVLNETTSVDFDYEDTNTVFRWLVILFVVIYVLRFIIEGSASILFKVFF